VLNWSFEIGLFSILHGRRDVEGILKDRL